MQRENSFRDAWRECETTQRIFRRYAEENQHLQECVSMIMKVRGTLLATATWGLFKFQVEEESQEPRARNTTFYGLMILNQTKDHYCSPSASLNCNS